MSQHAFAAEQYAPRAQDYVTSIVHSSGDDLDQIEAELRGCATARVLDLGCGGGHVSYRAAPHVAEVVACDVTPACWTWSPRTAAERGLTNITVRQAAAEHLPFDTRASISCCAASRRITGRTWRPVCARRGVC